MLRYLVDYNKSHLTPISLVFFQYAIIHLARISRTLLLNNGHALLVGLAGLGKNSCIRLAAALNDCSIFHEEIHQIYNTKDWTNELKKLLLSTGIDNCRTVMLANCSLIKDDDFFQDISMLLSIGDIPDLFSQEEKINIIEKIQNSIQRTAGKGK